MMGSLTLGEKTPTILLYLHSSPLILWSKAESQEGDANPNAGSGASNQYPEPLDTLKTTIELESIKDGLERSQASRVRVSGGGSTDIDRLSDLHLDQAPHANSLSLISITATPGTFSSILSSFGATILHYGGHSTLEGAMLFEDEEGGGVAKEVRPRELGKLVPERGNSNREVLGVSPPRSVIRNVSSSSTTATIPPQTPKLVFLSSCYSQASGEEFVNSLHIPHVICTTTKVRDEGIKDFVKRFYESLFCGESVGYSFGRAKAVYDINNNGDAEGNNGVPCPWVLLGSGDHDNAVLFPTGVIEKVFTNSDVDDYKRTSRLTNASKNNDFLARWRPYAPPRPLTMNFPPLTTPAKFTGRNYLLTQTLHQLNVNHKKLVSITSDVRGGIGKTELVGKLGEYEGGRRGGRWHSIVFVECEEVYKIVKDMGWDSKRSVSLSELMQAIITHCDSWSSGGGRGGGGGGGGGGGIPPSYSSNNNGNSTGRRSSSERFSGGLGWRVEEKCGEDNHKDRDRDRDRDRDSDSDSDRVEPNAADSAWSRFGDVDSVTKMINLLTYLHVTAKSSGRKSSASRASSMSRGVSASGSPVGRREGSVRIRQSSASESKLNVDPTYVDSDEEGSEDEVKIEREVVKKKVLFIFDDFEKILQNQFALAAFTLASDLLLCDDYNVHIVCTCTNNFSSFFSTFLKKERKKIENEKIKFKGIDLNTPEMSLECSRLHDYDSGVVITKHLERKLFYTEMMSEDVRRVIDSKEAQISQFSPVDWLLMMSHRPAVKNCEGKPGALISLARQLQNNEMGILDADIDEAEDSTGSGSGGNLRGYLGDRDGEDQMSERSILEGLEKWIRETMMKVHSKLKGGKESSTTKKEKVVDPWCVTLWARIAINANRKTKESVVGHEVDWETFVNALSAVVKRWTKGENTTARELNLDEREFLKERMNSSRSKRIKGNGDVRITFEDFVIFCDWLGPTLKTLNSISSEWQSTDPKLVHGFIGRSATEHMLQKSPLPGVFAIRFSESRAGWLAISFNDTMKRGGKVSSSNHCLVAVAEDGFTIYFQKGRRKYPTLAELIQECKKLRFLFSEKNTHLDKNEAFGVAPLSVYAYVGGWDGNSSSSVKSKSSEAKNTRPRRDKPMRK